MKERYFSNFFGDLPCFGHEIFRKSLSYQKMCFIVFPCMNSVLAYLKPPGEIMSKIIPTLSDGKSRVFFQLSSQKNSHKKTQRKLNLNIPAKNAPKT